MHFTLSEEHIMIQNAGRDFVINEYLHVVIDRDEHQRFLREQIMQLTDLGFYGHDGRYKIWG